MNFEPENVYHVYNRGNQRQTIFFEESHYLLFLRKIREQLLSCCDVLTWCLMPNHFHLMICTKSAGCKRRISGITEVQELSYKIGILLSGFTSVINKQRGLSGGLFQKKTKAKKLESAEDIIRCMHYIHQNPLSAGLTHDTLEGWRFSSFQDYSGLRNGTLCNAKKLFQITGYGQDSFLKDSYNVIDNESVKRFYE